MFFVYILQNPAGTFYVGHTENQSQRLQSHNDMGAIRQLVRPVKLKPPPGGRLG
jgi:predicted GIY-YIG superfamily endonuclease